MKNLIIKGDVKEVLLILERLAAQNPNMTIEQFLNKYHRETLILC